LNVGVPTFHTNPGSLMATGVRRFSVVPSPSWPLLFEPNAHTVPSEDTASV
jgi:hypothetical protein